MVEEGEAEVGDGPGDGFLADGMAVALEVVFFDGRAGGGGEADVDEATGFFSAAFDEGRGTGDAGDADGISGTEGVGGPLGHFDGGLGGDGAVFGDGLGGNVGKGDFGGGGVGEESAEENLGTAVDAGEGGPEEAGGAGFGDGQGLVAFGESADDPGFEGFVAFGVNVFGDAGIDFVGEGGNEGLAFLVGAGAGGEAEVDFSELGVGGEGDLGVLEEVLELFFEGGFADTYDAEGAGDEFGAVAEGAEAVGDGAVEHGEEFVGGAGEADDGFSVFGGKEAGGGAVGVGEGVGAVGAEGLAILAGDHRAVTPLHEDFDLAFEGRVFDERGIEGGGDAFAGEVVLGGAESADGEDDVGAGEGETEGFGETGEVVADGLAAVVVDAEVGEEASGGGGVGIDGLPEEEFGADRDNLGLHGFILTEVGWGRLVISGEGREEFASAGLERVVLG